LAPIYASIRPFWTRTLVRAAESYLEEVALPDALLPAAEVLDLGCGPASNLARLKRLGLPFGKYIGIDLSQAMLAIAQKTAMVDGQFVEGDSNQLPFAGESFDVVISTWMFSHLLKPEVAVREASRLLRPGGWLIVACFTRPRGRFGELLRIIEPRFMMRCIPPEKIERWSGLLDVRRFGRGSNIVLRLRKDADLERGQRK
jgi:ubiquinone/menaquinone biosynthesis C-methylase UbiE